MNFKENHGEADVDDDGDENGASQHTFLCIKKPILKSTFLYKINYYIKFSYSYHSPGRRRGQGWCLRTIIEMGAGVFVGPTVEFQVVMTLKSKTPVVGCEINPSVRVNGCGSGQPPPHTLNFTWLVLFSSLPVSYVFSLIFLQLHTIMILLWIAVYMFLFLI